MIGLRSCKEEEAALRFLSQEEQECLQFFEDTIGSLEDGLEEDERRGGGRAGAQTAAPGLVKPPPEGRASSPKSQDIIDLVHPEPDLVPTRDPVFNPSNPDFQSLVPTPESHFEIKPRREAGDGLPSEYNPPLPGGGGGGIYGPADGPSSYHPPGCIPTPVLIAQKIAENQAGGTSSFTPSSLLRRRSLESEKPPGPPTSAKPGRFPANISVVLGSKELQNPSLPSVNVHERRAQMLANLSGGSHPLLDLPPPPPAEQPPPAPRNAPTRSVSFRDPTPDKSRMEALSKLGLNRSRAMSGGGSSLSPLPDPLAAAEAECAKPEPAEAGETRPKRSEPPSQVDGRSEVLRSDSLKSREVRSPPPAEEPFPPPPPEVTSLEFNSYGGKSIVVHPSAPTRTEPPSSPTGPETRSPPSVLAAPSEFNSYGGKTKVMSPAPAPAPAPTPPVMTRSNLPDILSSHINQNQNLGLPARPEPLPIELNSYGGRSRSFNPSSVGGAHPPPETTATAKPPKASAPPPAPKPARHSYHGALQRASPRAPSPDPHKRRHGSMFRPQSITVQFSGRGATDESRREALRKLGLLKDS